VLDDLSRHSEFSISRSTPCSGMEIRPARVRVSMQQSLKVVYG
jgi:hypothetical protein